MHIIRFPCHYRPHLHQHCFKMDGIYTLVQLLPRCLMPCSSHERVAMRWAHRDPNEDGPRRTPVEDWRPTLPATAHRTGTQFRHTQPKKMRLIRRTADPPYVPSVCNTKDTNPAGRAVDAAALPKRRRSISFVWHAQRCCCRIAGHLNMGLVAQNCWHSTRSHSDATSTIHRPDHNW